MTEDTQATAPEEKAPAPDAGNGQQKEMHLTPTEFQKLNQLRDQASQVTLEIGQLEIRKGRLLGSVAQIEMQAQQVMNEAGKRLEIPDGVPWQVTPEGKIVFMPQPGRPAPEGGGK